MREFTFDQKADSPLLYERVAKKDKAAKAGMIHGDAKLQSLFHNREKAVGFWIPCVI